MSASLFDGLPRNFSVDNGRYACLMTPMELPSNVRKWHLCRVT